MASKLITVATVAHKVATTTRAVAAAVSHLSVTNPIPTGSKVVASVKVSVAALRKLPMRAGTTATGTTGTPTTAGLTAGQMVMKNLAVSAIASVREGTNPTDPTRRNLEYAALKGVGMLERAEVHITALEAKVAQLTRDRDARGDPESVVAALRGLHADATAAMAVRELIRTTLDSQPPVLDEKGKPTKELKKRAAAAWDRVIDSKLVPDEFVEETSESVAQFLHTVVRAYNTVAHPTSLEVAHGIVQIGDIVDHNRRHAASLAVLICKAMHAA